MGTVGASRTHGRPRTFSNPGHLNSPSATFDSLTLRSSYSHPWSHAASMATKASPALEPILQTSPVHNSEVRGLFSCRCASLSSKYQPSGTKIRIRAKGRTNAINRSAPRQIQHRGRSSQSSVQGETHVESLPPPPHKAASLTLITPHCFGRALWKCSFF